MYTFLICFLFSAFNGLNTFWFTSLIDMHSLLRLFDWVLIKIKQEKRSWILYKITEDDVATSNCFCVWTYVWWWVFIIRLFRDENCAKGNKKRDWIYQMIKTEISFNEIFKIYQNFTFLRERFNIFWIMYWNLFEMKI